MKCFITGVAGFLASHVADQLLASGHEVVGVDSLIGGELSNLPDGVEFYEADCGDLDAMVAHSKGCDVMVHAACTAYEGLSVFSPHFITQNTFQITSTLLSAAVQNGVKKFLYCSSMARYGTQETLPFTEDMDCRPQDPYGIAKFASELLVRNLCEIHELQYVIFVPHNIIGPRQKYDDPFRNVASIMVNRMLQGVQPIIYGDGTQKRCFSFVEDSISCFEKALFRDDVNGKIYNIGPDEEFVTINELAEEIADILNFDLNPIYMPSRPLEVNLAHCSADRIRKEFGYTTETTLRDGLERLVEYIVQRGPKPFKYHIDLEIKNDLTPLTWKERLF